MLNRRQKAFVAAYEGNATDAARKAGYTGSARSLEVTGGRLLRHAEVAAALAARETKPEDAKLAPIIASRERRQAFWSETMLNAELEMSVRLKASELLGKSQADFVDRHQHVVGPTLAALVEASFKQPAEPPAPATPAPRRAADTPLAPADPPAAKPLELGDLEALVSSVPTGRGV